HRPLVTGRYRLVVRRVGQDPLRRALEDREPLDLVGDRGRDLEAGRTRADQRDLLAGEVQVGRPARGVERRTGERLHAVEGRLPRVAECADRTDGEARVDGRFPTAGVPDDNFPPPGRVVPRRPHDLGVEATVRAEPVLVDDVLEVALQLRLPAEV